MTKLVLHAGGGSGLNYASLKQKQKKGEIYTYTYGWVIQHWTRGNPSLFLRVGHRGVSSWIAPLISTYFQ